MPTPTEYWNWKFTDDTGKRRTTRWKLKRVDALATLKDPEPVEHTREVRNLPDNTSEHHLTSAFMKKP